MADEINLSAATEKLQEMFSSDEGKQQINDIISMLGGGQNDEKREDKKRSDNNFGMNIDPDNIEMMMKIQHIMSAMNNGETTRQTNFLKSLGPLLKPEKRDKINNAIKFLSIGKAIEAFRNM